MLLEGCESCVVEHNSFHHLDTNAVFLSGYNRDTVIRGNEFVWLGRASLTTEANRAASNQPTCTLSAFHCAISCVGSFSVSDWHALPWSDLAAGTMLLDASASVLVYLCMAGSGYYALSYPYALAAENAIASWGYLDGETKSNMTNSGLGGLQPRGTLVEGNWVHEVSLPCRVCQTDSTVRRERLPLLCVPARCRPPLIWIAVVECYLATHYRLCICV